VPLTPPQYRFGRIWLLLGWGMAVSVLVLSLIPIDVDLGQGSDKVEHFIAYAGLAFWFGLLYAGWRRQLGFALGFIVMGVVIEFLQGMTDYRSFEVADMVADGTGALLGFALLRTPLGNVLHWVERLLGRIAPRSLP
jgi:uncharacterized protein YfiM (DUF2279 family)